MLLCHLFAGRSSNASCWPVTIFLRRARSDVPYPCHDFNQNVEMNFQHLPIPKLLCAFAILNALMTVMPVRGEPTANSEPAGKKILAEEEPGKEVTPLNKRDR